MAIKIVNNGGNTNGLQLIWHRRDLRLHDNELYQLNDDGERFPSISLFVFDEEYFQPTKSSISGYKTVWCGPHAAQALIEAVSCLRESIRSLGGVLLVRSGDPALIIPQLAEELGATKIIFHEEPGVYERHVAQKLKQHYVFSTDVKLESKVGYTLYHPNDLPRDPNQWDELAHPKRQKRKKKKKVVSPIITDKSTLDLVDVSPDRFRGLNRIMGDFRKAARSCTHVRRLLNSPESLILPADFDVHEIKAGSIPTLEELTKPLLDLLEKQQTILGIDAETIRFVIQAAIDNRDKKDSLRHGEQAALSRLDSFIGSGDAAKADRSKADVSDNDSSRLSTAFSTGSLSPRLVYWRASGEEGCNWMTSHLEMRDFFLYTAFCQDSRLFASKGIPVARKAEVQWKSLKDDSTLWTRWATGKTQLPLVDAAMKELMATGYCSNRVRQNAASVLTKDLQIDWRAGAEWFQFLLEDHCVGANHGNWLYFSGVGPDPKNRHFRTVSQMKRYDETAEYVQKWLPALRHVKDLEHAFRPWDFQISGFESTIVDPGSQYTWQDKQLLESTGKLLEADAT
jgi:deoxyribodipyrimidine photo-lyase